MKTAAIARKLQWLFLVAVISLVGCGGGGDGSDPIVGYISINGQDTFQTDQNDIILSGKSFIPPGSSCYVDQTISFRDIPGMYSITWENHANASSGTPHIWPFCESEISWDVFGWQNVPLELGENQIIVTLTTDDGEWQDTLNVTRVPDVTPPSVVLTTPDETVMYNGIITFLFSEPVDLITLEDGRFTLRNATTNILVPGTDITTGSIFGFLPVSLESGTTYRARIENVNDLAGNTMAEPFEWSFTTE